MTKFEYDINSVVIGRAVRAKTKSEERQEQLEKLRKWFPKGSTVYTVLRHVSRSGMQRQISVVCLTVDKGEIVDLHPNYSVAKLLGRRLKTGWHDSVTCNGCGMDMGFDLAYALSNALYGDGYALKHKWL